MPIEKNKEQCEKQTNDNSLHRNYFNQCGITITIKKVINSLHAKTHPMSTNENHL